MSVVVVEKLTENEEQKREKYKRTDEQKEQKTVKDQVISFRFDLSKYHNNISVY
jgi:hypothetical protein